MSNETRDPYEGDYIGSDDLPQDGRAVDVEISEITPPNSVKDATGRLIDKKILHFKGAKKALILNKTNWRILKAIHGPKETTWPGQTITLAVRVLPSTFGQEQVPVARVIPPKGALLPFAVRKHLGQPVPAATS